jgi:hypothetical protein
VAVSAVQGLTVESAWERIASTVHDRTTFLRPELTHVGAGVVPGPVAGGRPNVIAFVIYIQELPPPDVGAIQARLFEAVTRRRSDARVSPLEKDPLLADVAQRYAEALAASRGKMTKEKDEQLLAPVRTGYRTINLIGGYKKEPLDFAEEPGIVGTAKLLGIGVAVGFTPDLGKNSVFVEIVVATPPEAPPAPAKKGSKGKKK